MKKITILSVITFLFIGNIFTQEETSNNLKHIPSIGVHGGALSYIGDIEGTNGTVLTYWKPAYGFYLEKKLGSILGVSINGTFGEVSQSQLDDNVFLNFESSITNFDLNLLLDFDNGKIIKKSSLFSPYFSIGIGYLSFDPKGDLSTNGLLYNHWNDGTLRDIAQFTPGADTASTIITRDYDYETVLRDSVINYSKTSVTVPIRLGLKFKLSSRIDTRISVAYILTMTDYIDNVAVGGNDKLLYTSFGLQYNFAPSNIEDKKFKDFDFSDLDKGDSDGDGVSDSRDLCQRTPKGVKVNSKGCPLDGDKDGVPDYKDEEKDTPKGMSVNQKGITLTDEMIEEQEKMKESIETERKTFVTEDLSEEEIQEIQKEYQETNKGTSVNTKTIPEKFRELDLDGDNYLSAKEVTKVINGFFEGGHNLSAKDLNVLIDFYFDQ